MTEILKQSLLHKIMAFLARPGKSPRSGAKQNAALYPSGAAPDNLVLTPARDPSTMQTINWRTSMMVTTGQVQYRVKDMNSWQVANARYKTMHAPELDKDQTTHHFYITLIGLTPGTVYEYRVGYAGDWSQIYGFTTAAVNDRPFSCAFMGDVQGSFLSLQSALKMFERKYPETAFYMLTGDFVNNCNQRNEWDDFMAHTVNLFSGKFIAPVPGNRDYVNSSVKDPGPLTSYFELPANGVPGLPFTYAFNYNDAFFVVLDTNQPPEKQTRWLEDNLRQARAKGYCWLIAAMHNAGFSVKGKPGKHVLHAQWLPLFDAYGVDLVLTGHVHSYVRTMPVFKGQVSQEGGTVYVAATSSELFYESAETGFEALTLSNVQTWQMLEFEPLNNGRNRLRYRAFNFAGGQVVDEFTIEK